MGCPSCRGENRSPVQVDIKGDGEYAAPHPRIYDITSKANGLQRRLKECSGGLLYRVM